MGSVFFVRRFKNLPALNSSLVTISNYDDRFKKPLFGGYRDINVLLRVVHSRNPSFWIVHLASELHRMLPPTPWMACFLFTHCSGEFISLQRFIHQLCFVPKR